MRARSERGRVSALRRAVRTGATAGLPARQDDQPELAAYAAWVRVRGLRRALRSAVCSMGSATLVFAALMCLTITFTGPVALLLCCGFVAGGTLLYRVRKPKPSRGALPRAPAAWDRSTVEALCALAGRGTCAERQFACGALRRALEAMGQEGYATLSEGSQGALRRELRGDDAELAASVVRLYARFGRLPERRLPSKMVSHADTAGQRQMILSAAVGAIRDIDARLTQSQGAHALLRPAEASAGLLRPSARDMAGGETKCSLPGSADPGRPGRRDVAGQATRRPG